MAYSHDLAFVSPRGDSEVRIGKGFLPDHEAVVTRGLKWVGKPREDAATVMVDARRLAVHDPVVADNLTAKRVADALVAQTHSQDRHHWREPREHGVGHAGLARRAWP